MRVNYFNEELPRGMALTIGGLLLVNGEEVEFSEDELAFYEAQQGESLENALSRVQFATVDGKSYEAPVIKENETSTDDTQETETEVGE